MKLTIENLASESSLNFWIIAGFSLIALLLTFWRMKGGFGPQNLRAVGIVLVSGLVCMLSISQKDQLSTAIGVLGAIAGYLFGSQRENERNDIEKSSASTKNSTFGDGAKIAGRDINETLQNIKGDVDSIKDSVVNINSKIISNNRQDYWIISYYPEDGEPIESIVRQASSIDSDGWRLINISPSWNRDGMLSVWMRESTENHAQFFHGPQMERL